MLDNKEYLFDFKVYKEDKDFKVLCVVLCKLLLK